MYHKEMFIPFRTEGTTVLSDTYVPSDHKLETFSHIFLTDCEVEWDPVNVTMYRNMPYRDKSCVAEISRKLRKVNLTDFFQDSDLILGSVTNSMVAYTALEGLVSAINVKEEAPSRISNEKTKANMAHKKGKVKKVVSNSRHFMVKPEYLARKINIGLYKVKQVLRVTTQCVICTSVHPIRVVPSPDENN